MPCRDWDEDNKPLQNQKVYSTLGPEYFPPSRADRQRTNKIHHLTDMLCVVCKILETEGKLPEDISIWWEQHKKEDAMRRKR